MRRMVTVKTCEGGWGLMQDNQIQIMLIFNYKKRSVTNRGSEIVLQKSNDRSQLHYTIKS